MANLVFDFLHNYKTGERRESDPSDAYQYDEGHVFEAVVPVAVTSCEIHYWARGFDEAEAYTPASITQNTDNSYTITGNIPNKFFETYGDLKVYIVVTDGDASITTYEGRIHICERSKPDDYVDDDPDNEATRVLVEARAAAQTATAAAQTAQDVADSIPADYTQMSEDVDTLKTDVSGLKEDISHIGGLSEDIKQAMLQIARKVAYIDEHGQDYYDDLYDALYAVTGISIDARSIMLTDIGSTQQLTATTTPPGGAVTWASSDTSIATVSNTGLVTSVGYGSCTITASSGSVSASCAVAVSQVTLTSISADYQQSGTVYDTASLDSLKGDLTVTATYSDSSTATVTEYTLSGTLTAGTSTITVSYGGKTATFNVTVTAAPTLSSISAVYTQSGTVYDTDTLDSLKDDLVVTAHYSDSTTQTVTEYTLTGTLTVGTSTITVAYGGKTATFNVTVSEYVDPRVLLYNWDLTSSLTDTVGGKTATLTGATQDSSGVHLTAVSNHADFSGILAIGRTVEVDVASYSRQGTAHGRFIMTSGTEGIIYNKSGYWALYLSSGWQNSEITDPTYFNGKTVVMKFSSAESGTLVSVYCNDVLIVERVLESSVSNMMLGSNNSNAAYNSIFTAVRVYEGV